MAGAWDGKVGGIGHWGGWGTPSAPTVAEPSPVQTTLPTSAYGQTIPVIYGKARLPGAYIWCAPIITVTETHMEWWDTVTTTTTLMSCRLRFARPLVPDSTWAVKRIWAQGKLVYDNTTGYRAKGLKFRFYDGRSTQDRDPTMVKEEGASNVSAHRGYIDIVLTDFPIQDFGAPPTVEAEFIQSTSSAVQSSSFQAFSSDELTTWASIDPDSDTFYSYSDAIGTIRRFSISALREIYAIQVSGLGRAYSSLGFGLFRYFHYLDRILTVGFVPGSGGGTYPLILNPITGVSVADAVDPIGDAGQTVCCAGACVLPTGTGLALIASFHLGYVSIYRFTDSAISRLSISGVSWDGRGVPQCILAGEIRDNDCDFWVCAGSSLWKLTINAAGLVTTTVEFSTFADDLNYAVLYDDDIVVWTDNGTATRIDGATSSTVWTASVPYQIPVATSQNLAPPDMQVLDDEFYYQDLTAYRFTNLQTGVTTSISKGSAATNLYNYYGPSNTLITTKNVAAAIRSRFNVATGTDLFNLSDFLTDLMVYGGGFDPSEIQTVNIDDQIEGAVVDVTAGVRDIARSICEPYSISMFER
ncbi:MAG: hypothetical protein E5V62_02960 [Mesorhizobium sp.]|uniref:hypothetical protein n=1 Tax=Mesorhizobium sp. TaxID=1871066 RepID=UPI00122B56E6|nr:hypothetical protein [Mesorhizobium sp.]TIW37125.1 MAG: hypothetical protein E5V62_02960 [Mesorhizobium sp.]